MYEMEGPRPASRRRPADFSASFAPLDHLPGPGTLPVLRSTGSPGGSGGSPRRWLGLSSLPTSRGFPQAGWRQVFPHRWLKAFFSPNDRGFPQVKRIKFSLRRVAKSFLLNHATRGFPSAAQSEVFPFADGPELSSPHMTRGFPSATNLEVFPVPLARGSSLRVPLLPGGTGLSPGPEAPESAQYRVARGFPRTGGSEFPPCLWRRTSPCPKARSCPLPGGSGFPLRRLPSLVVKKFLRLSPGLHKGFRAAISRFFGRPQAIHS